MFILKITVSTKNKTKQNQKTKTKQKQNKKKKKEVYNFEILKTFEICCPQNKFNMLCITVTMEVYS